MQLNVVCVLYINMELLLLLIPLLLLNYVLLSASHYDYNLWIIYGKDFPVVGESKLNKLLRECSMK